MSPLHKPMAWLTGEPKTPPIPSDVRIEAGYLFRLVQAGMLIPMPKNRYMPEIGKNCHELRINSSDGTWRFIYCIDSDAIVCLDYFCKKTKQTPESEIELCKKRLKEYLTLKGGSK